MNKRIGNCELSDMCVFSFHPVKSITTAEGGIVTTNNKKFFNDLKLYREHGINRNFTNKKVRPKYYEQIKLGYNYRMNEIEAAIGIEQLKKLDSFISKRVEIYNLYKSKLKNNLFEYPNISMDSDSSHHLFVILLKKNIRKLRDSIFSKLLKKGIGGNIHYMPIYKHSFYKNYLKKNFFLKNSERYYNTCISIPIFPTLSKNQQRVVVKVINSLK
jgi:dTDP-4-amino-4,6-dideoxygalactose transaminase